MTFPSIRSRAGIAAVAAVTIATTGAGAATLHRFTVTQGTATGSLGATTFTQNSATSGALQGEVASSPNTSIRIPFGVLGEYDSVGSSTFGIGVAGISTTGYAVGGESVGGSAGVIALNSGTGNGLEAYTHASSATAAAIVAENTGMGPAIMATGDNYDGVDSYISADEAAALYGVDEAPDAGFGLFAASESPNGAAVIGESISSVGMVAAGGSGTAGAPALGAAALAPNTDIFDGIATGTDGNTYETTSLTTPSQNNSGTTLNSSVGGSNDLSINGDIIITGAVYSGCTNFPESAPKTDCSPAASPLATRTSTGAMVRGYAATHASATMEDEGEAQLVNGYAHVSLDPTFASAISTRTPYLVFTTPRGDGAGLFVAHATANGFDVRQSLGGRSSMAFDYRIVAHPYGSDGTRMAFVSPARGHSAPLSAKMAARLRLVRRMGAKHHAIPHHTPHSLVSMTGHVSR